MSRIKFFILGIFVIFVCVATVAGARTNAVAARNVTTTTIVKASFYGKAFHGKQTSNGETFDMYANTAAHPTLPFDTEVLLTYPASCERQWKCYIHVCKVQRSVDKCVKRPARKCRSAVARINDRGPFVPGRSIDVSRKIARDLGFDYVGVATIKMEVLP